ncbi:MAG: replication protein [Parashewanella sp.]
MTNAAEIINFPKKESKGPNYVKADTDNGYYRVANELGLALCKTQLSDRESRLLNAIMLKTFGWQKTLDWICYEQLAEMTNIDISNIGKTKTALVKRNILIVSGKKIGVNPVVSEWLNKSKPTQNKISQNRLMEKSEPTYGKVETDSNKSQNRLTQKKDTITKDTITKDTCNNSPKQRVKKPDSFKQFFKFYPLHRKGGTDAQAWKAWQSEKLTNDDAQQALDWITQAAKVNADWRTDAKGQFVCGITKFIRDRKWLTPLPQISHPSLKNNSQSVNEHNNQVVDEWLAEQQSKHMELSHEE